MNKKVLITALSLSLASFGLNAETKPQHKTHLGHSECSICDSQETRGTKNHGQCIKACKEYHRKHGYDRYDKNDYASDRGKKKGWDHNRNGRYDWDEHMDDIYDGIAINLDQFLTEARDKFEKMDTNNDWVFNHLDRYHFGKAITFDEFMDKARDRFYKRDTNNDGLINHLD